MSGDNLAILLFAWGLAVTFGLEGRKEEGRRRWLFWGTASLFAIAGPFWPSLAKVWPQGEDFGRRVATDPTAWFILFIAGMLWVSLSANTAVVRRAIPRIGPGAPITAPEVKQELQAEIVAVNNRLVERLGKLEASAGEPKIPKSAVNWGPYKVMENWTLGTFACILANKDPGAGISTNDTWAFYNLVQQEVMSGRLGLVSTEWDDKGNPSEESRIARSAAIVWAEAHGQDVSHVK